MSNLPPARRRTDSLTHGQLLFEGAYSSEDLMPKALLPRNWRVQYATPREIEVQP